jgi:hypothetical protein
MPTPPTTIEIAEIATKTRPTIPKIVLTCARICSKVCT